MNGRSWHGFYRIEFFPPPDHNDKEWSDTKSWRARKSKTPLKVRGACLQYRGDWPNPFLWRGVTDMSCPKAAACSDATWRRRLLTSTQWMHERVAEGFLLISCVFFAWFHIRLFYFGLDAHGRLGHRTRLLGEHFVGNLPVDGGLVTDPRKLERITLRGEHLRGEHMSPLKI